MSSRVNLETLNSLVSDGYLRSQTHPTLPLLLYNYTEQCQFKRHWTPETLMCRGLITDTSGNIIARPFPKFFNLDEHFDYGGEIPQERFTVTEKMDGSLLIYTRHGGKDVVATRGSFTSEQALKGAEMLKKVPKHLFLPGITYLFEIIYPENRIVVDYGSEEKLVLLSMIVSKTGKEYHPTKAWNFYPPVEAVKEYPGYKIDELTSFEEPNKEGFVIRFESGLRLKIKFEEYKRLHKLLTGVSEKTIWECLSQGTGIEKMIENVPDEFHEWVDAVAYSLRDQYDIIYDAASQIYEEVKHLPLRIDQALHIAAKADEPSVIFALLDEKDPAPIIWKMLKPRGDKPFKLGEES